MRRILSWIAALLLVLAAAALVWWSWRTSSSPPAPVAEWPAAAVVLAGDGAAGVTDGSRDRARFSDPFGVAAAANGTVYVSDAGEAQRIRAISRDGQVTTVAGGQAGFNDGDGPAARFNSPSGLALDASGALYIADTGNNAIRKLTPDGRVSTIAGGGPAGFHDGPPNEAQFNGPIGVAVDVTGRVLVADTYNDRIRVITPDGFVGTIAGGPDAGSADGRGSEARFHTPTGIAVNRAGTIFVADTGNGLVRQIDAAGEVTTPSWQMPGGLVNPIGIAADEGGRIHVTDGRGAIVSLSPEAPPHSVGGMAAGFRDGRDAAALFRDPAGVAVAGPGRLIVADAGNALIRLVLSRSQLEARPPASPRIAPHFDAARFGWQPLLWPVAPMSGPHEVAGTLGEARGAEGSERFHAGVDVRADEGVLVHAVRDAIASSPLGAGEFGRLTEWLRLGPVGYVHVRVGRTRTNHLLDAQRFAPVRDPQGGLVGVRVKRGARFETGDAIGTVNRFNHVHLNVGWPGEEHNPLRFNLAQFEDSVLPTIPPGGIRLYDQHWTPLVQRGRGRVLVAGGVRVVVDAWDQADGNRPGRRLGLYAIGYQVLDRSGSPVPGQVPTTETLSFDQLAVAPDAARIVFAPGSGIPVYGNRRTRFLYVATNRLRGGRATESLWDTATLAPGDYTLRILARDIRGNAAIANRDLAVTVVHPTIGPP